MTARASALLLAGLLASTAPWSAASAQSATSSGAQDAETHMATQSGGATATDAASTRTATKARSRKAANPQMDVSNSRTPTGPYTSTVQPDTSDLSGSTGASITLPQGSPPPGVTPPNGSAPDTGGGAAVDNTPNAEGGPHAS